MVLAYHIASGLCPCMTWHFALVHGLMMTEIGDMLANQLLSVKTTVHAGIAAGMGASP